MGRSDVKCQITSEKLSFRKKTMKASSKGGGFGKGEGGNLSDSRPFWPQYANNWKRKKLREGKGIPTAQKSAFYPDIMEQGKRGGGNREKGIVGG